MFLLGCLLVLLITVRTYAEAALCVVVSEASVDIIMREC